MKIPKFKNTNFAFIVIILSVGFLFRILIAKLALHVDLVSNAEWGEWFYFKGVKGFYENTIWTYSWPTQPPLASLIYGFDRYLYNWLLEAFRSIGHFIVNYHLAPGHLRFWFDFTIWFDVAKVNPVIAFPVGYFVTMKLLPIIADLVIAGIIYTVSPSKKKGIIYSIIYLISPFSWYLSALWGQIDQLAFVPLLLAFLFEARKKYPVLSMALLAISLSIKPTGLILVPFFLYLYLKNKHAIWNYMLGVGFAIAVFWVSTGVFTDVNPILYAKEVLYPKIFLKSEMRITTNAFNFWRIFTGSKAYGDTTAFLLIPARYWSLIFWIILNILACRLNQKVNIKNVILGFFVVSAGSFIFMTNMLDRYFFAGIVGGLLVTIYYPKLLNYWVSISLIFFLNLFSQWWFPERIGFLKEIMLWNEGAITRLLSLANVVLFVMMVKQIFKSKVRRVDST